MDNNWFSLILLALAAGFLPWQFSAEILILRKERGLARTVALVGGITLWRLVLALLLAFIFAGGLGVSRNGFGAIIEFIGSGFEGAIEQIQIRQGPVLDVLLILSGALLLVRALRIWAGAPDPDAPPDKILATVDSIDAGAAVVFGLIWTALCASQWIFFVAGVNQILDLPDGLAGKLAAYLLFLAISSLLILAPIVLYVVQPERAQAYLAAVDDKLNRGMRYIGLFLMGGIGLLLA